MSGLYLVALLVSAAGVLTIDVRWRLALAAPACNPGGLPGGWRAGVVVVVGAAGLVVWDLVAIDLGFYGLGGGAALLGVEVAPHLPLEELVFVVFLSHLTLVVAGIALRLGARAGRGRRAAPTREAR